MRKTFKYKAKINKQTEANCFLWLTLCRTLYNLCLEQRILFWKQWRQSLSAVSQKNELPEFKREFPEFKQVGSQVLQDVVERLDRAFQSFFRRTKDGKQKPGFPRFQGKNRYDSFTLKQAGWKLEGRNLYVKGLGKFKLFLSRPMEGRIKTITIRRTRIEKWLVSFSCDDVPTKPFPKTDKEVGIDVGIKHFLVDSDGREVENPKYLRESEKELRRRQRSPSRKKKGSKRRAKAKHLVAKTYEKVHNQRVDFAQKLALYYVTLYSVIYIEKLNIKGMVKNRHLSKSISDAAWGMFFNCLSYKAEWADGRKVVKVPPNGTSQICSDCGADVPKSLFVRIHRCPKCGCTKDRDFNAAINIKNRGGHSRSDVKLAVP